MSRYAFLVCEEAGQFIWLGKIVEDEATGQRYFHIGDPDRPPNSENTVLMKAIMKFMVQNMGRVLKVLAEEEFESQFDEEAAVAIGIEGFPDISFEDYVACFKG